MREAARDRLGSAGSSRADEQQRTAAVLDRLALLGGGRRGLRIRF
jgi:hypothetical protein